MKKERGLIPLNVTAPNTGQLSWLPKNPRQWTKEDVERTAKSITEDEDFLEDRPLLAVYENKEYVIFAGNLRREGCIKAGVKEVPCIIYAPEDEDDQLTIKRRAMKDNGSFGSWDYDELANAWDDLPLADWGIDIPEIEAEAEEKEVQEDDFNEAEDEIHVRCKVGDIWQLGDHRLMCGDSTDLETVKKLMGGGIAKLMITDPPYGVSYSDKNAYLNAISRGNSIQTPIENDHHTEQEMYELWRKVFTNAYEVTDKCMAYYVFGAQGGELLLLLLLALKDSKLAPRHGLVWVKNNHVLGRADYNYKHEPITYGWKSDGTHKFYAKFDVSVIEADKPLKSDLHPTMKPVPLIARLMNNSSLPGDEILDLFGGSGTTLIAAEELGRKCYMMELDAHYCDVIIARWEKLTGREAVKIN